MSIVHTFKPFRSPYRFVFKDPDTGREFSARSKTILLKQIVSYRAQNNLEPLEELSVTIDNYLCGLPENVGACQPLPLKRGLLTTLRGGIALIENFFYGDENMVSQEEAERRAGICVTCPHNVFPDKELFVKWSDDVAEAATRGRKVSTHDKLGNCEVCSCPLRAKVFYGGKVKLTEEQNKQLPDFCWAKRKD